MCAMPCSRVSVVVTTPKFWGLLIGLEPKLSRVTWVHYAVACLVYSVTTKTVKFR